MKSLLLIVTLFCLLAVLQAQDELPFLSEDRNLSGIWYHKAVVNDLNITELRPMKIQKSPFVVRALHKGNMQIVSFFMKNSDCVQLEFLVEKTEKPGQYKAFWDALLIYIYELPDMDHYIFYNECDLPDQKLHVGELIGKDPKENPQALEEFKKFIQRKGFPQQNLIVPEQREMCVPEVLNAASQNCKPQDNSVSNA